MGRGRRGDRHGGHGGDRAPVRGDRDTARRRGPAARSAGGGGRVAAARRGCAQQGQQILAADVARLTNAVAGNTRDIQTLGQAVDRLERNQAKVQAAVGELSQLCARSFENIENRLGAGA